MQSDFPFGMAALLLLGSFFSISILGWTPVFVTIFTIGLAVYILTQLR